jgi:argininosuccinate lyase
MTRYLWSKSDGNPGELRELIQEFLSGEDVELDREIFRYDIRATAAHTAGLEKIGLLSSSEVHAVRDALAELAARFDSGSYSLERPMEDGHTAIEFWLTERLPEIGPKVHTGRSRNDQVQVAMRLYLRDVLEHLSRHCETFAGACLGRAREDELTPMPGYTHLQRAVPSTVGLWMGAFAESFLDIAGLTDLTSGWIDSCPLGSAAGYGVNLNLPRETVARELGFPRVQMNPMYVQNSRGRFELQVLSVFAQATLELRRFAWDLSLYTTSEFGFVRLPEQWRTGSSIMPNKSNPDFVELLRGQHAVVQGAISELHGLLSLPSGYHRDLQLVKPPVFRAIRCALKALGLAAQLVPELILDRRRMRDAIDDGMYATDIALERVAIQGMPFRDAYRTPVTEGELAGRSPESSIRARVSPGACADPGLDGLAQRLRDRSASRSNQSPASPGS